MHYKEAGYRFYIFEKINKNFLRTSTLTRKSKKRTAYNPTYKINS